MGADCCKKENKNKQQEDAIRREYEMQNRYNQNQNPNIAANNYVAQNHPDNFAYDPIANNSMDKSIYIF